MTTPAKLFGKNLADYDEVDVDELLAQLSAEEIKILAKEVDPDVRIYLYTSDTACHQWFNWMQCCETTNWFFFQFCVIFFSGFVGQFLAAEPA